LPKTKVRTFSSNDKLVEQRRKLIAEKSTLVFLRNGYQQTTMRDIGKALKMAPGSLYHYIGSKKDILHLIVLNTALGAQPMKDYVNQFGKVSYSKALSEAMLFCFKNADSIVNSLMLFNRYILEFSREDFHHLLVSEIDVADYFEQLIKGGVDAGAFKCNDPRLLAHDILMYTNDWALRKWYLKQYYTLEEYTEEHTRMILELLKAKDD